MSDDTAEIRTGYASNTGVERYRCVSPFGVHLLKYAMY